MFVCWRYLLTWIITEMMMAVVVVFVMFGDLIETRIDSVVKIVTGWIVCSIAADCYCYCCWCCL